MVFFLDIRISFGQSPDDSTQSRTLQPITIQAATAIQDIQRLDPVKGTYIFSGKKNEVIELTKITVPLSEKYGRQIFAKIPGVFVYDMDGTGNQLNISTRGLDPHRGWEFNNRKDGILTNSDMYGYPASHYSIPMEAVERIELVRGTGSLQYGAQFGGMLNYIGKQPDTTRKFGFETINTVGSYGRISTYASVSGKIGKFRYSAWVNKKGSKGYRDNSNSTSDAEAISLFYDPSKFLSLKLEWTHSRYLTQLPGPLTDLMFQANPRTATRSRNYYSPDIHIPSFSLVWNPGKNTRVEFTSSAVLGTRNSVLFDRPATVADTLVSATLEFNKRQVDIDQFNSYTSEVRLKQAYLLFGKSHTLTAGAQIMNNDLHRRQLGQGTSGSDYDLTLTNPTFGRDLHFKTKNLALFVENLWKLSPRFSITTGVRMELGASRMTGTMGYYPASALPNTIKHSFPLLGINAQYDLTPTIQTYSGWSQAYRPVIFKDIIPGSVYEISDQNLKDASGYNAEMGFRGKWKILIWDLSAFYLQYNHRLGTLAQTDGAGNLQILRTNIGNSGTVGMEIFVQADFRTGPKGLISIFTSTSFMDARYQTARIRSGNDNVDLKNKMVESVPRTISRNGVSFKYGKLSLSGLFSYTSESFADALNSRIPGPTGATGLVPSYSLVDFNAGFQFTENIKIQINASNVLDKQYFTKRPQFYPGPGIWPSDGRTFSFTALLRV